VGADTLFGPFALAVLSATAAGLLARFWIDPPRSLCLPLPRTTLTQFLRRAHPWLVTAPRALKDPLILLTASPLSSIARMTV
jgi:hypothetical protein